MSTLSQDFERLTQAWRLIAEHSSTTYRQYLLSRSASAHGLTRAEMRRLFGLWLVERQSNGEGGAA